MDESTKDRAVVTTTTTTNSTGVYRPLPEHHIRVLCLHPSVDGDAQLHGELVISKLEDDAAFETISYVWGPPVFSETISFPEGTVNITPSLASALKRFRLSDAPRMLWADALCINQADNVEKGQQVAMMGQIYKSASQCLAWLGPSTDETAESAESLRALAERAVQFDLAPDMCGVEHWGQKPMIKQSLSGSREAAAIDQDISTVWAEAANAPLGDVFGRAWFRRLWIIQEVAVSSKIELYCGGEVFPWGAVTGAVTLIEVLRNHRQGRVTRPPDLWRVLSMVAYRNNRRFYSEFDKVNFPLLQFGDPYSGMLFECQDDRDRIYAFLSLSPPQCPISFKPDYTKTTAQVYADFAKQFLQHGDVYMLGGGGVYRRSHPVHPIVADSIGLDYLPSWATEYRLAEERAFDLPWNANKFLSCGDNIESAPILPPTDLPDRPLWRDSVVMIPVRYIDAPNDDIHLQVTRDGEPINVAGPVSPTTFRWITTMPEGYPVGVEIVAQLILDRARKSLNGGDRYFTGEDVRVAVMRTLLADATSAAVRVFLGRDVDVKDEKEMLALWELYEKYCINHHDPELIKILRPTGQSQEGFSRLSEGAKEALKIHDAIWEVMQHSLFVTTEKGYIGLVPSVSQDGDFIVQIDGMHTPVVVRPVFPGEMDIVTYIGPCFLHGFMYGDGQRADVKKTVFF